MFPSSSHASEMSSHTLDRNLNITYEHPSASNVSTNHKSGVCALPHDSGHHSLYRVCNCHPLNPILCSKHTDAGSSQTFACTHYQQPSESFQNYLGNDLYLIPKSDNTGIVYEDGFQNYFSQNEIYPGPLCPSPRVLRTSESYLQEIIDVHTGKIDVKNLNENGVDTSAPSLSGSEINARKEPDPNDKLSNSNGRITTAHHPIFEQHKNMEQCHNVGQRQNIKQRRNMGRRKNIHQSGRIELSTIFADGLEHNGPNFAKNWITPC